MAKTAKKSKAAKKAGFKGLVLSMAIIASAALFLPTTVFLFFALLPTMAAYFADRSRGLKALSVGAMNLAGATPFLLHIWMTHNTVSNALMLITDPRVMIVILLSAAVGWLIEWAMSGIIVTIMVQRSNGRLKWIDKRKNDLVDRWGREVTGELALDAYGFPVETAGHNKQNLAEKAAENKKSIEAQGANK